MTLTGRFFLQHLESHRLRTQQHGLDVAIGQGLVDWEILPFSGASDAGQESFEVKRSKDFAQTGSGCTSLQNRCLGGRCCTTRALCCDFETISSSSCGNHCWHDVSIRPRGICPCRLTYEGAPTADELCWLSLFVSSRHVPNPLDCGDVEPARMSSRTFMDRARLTSTLDYASSPLLNQSSHLIAS